MTHAKTHAKKFEPRKKIYIWHTQPRKNYDLRKMLTHVKNILIHVTRATHVKIWLTQTTHSLNPRYYASHVI